MIDWHCHVLPRMDDGCKNVEESVSLANMLTMQHIDTVVATPHFYANDESIDSFLSRRHESFEILNEHLPKNTLKVVLGAEVRYYQGISRMQGLEALRIDGSKLLLLEMPMSHWTEYMIRELIEMSGRTNIKIVLAHIERYLRIQSKNVWERLVQNGIMMQSNASFFNSFATRRKALSLLSRGMISFLGSDSHNTTSRPPRIADAYGVVSKKLGIDFICQLNEYGYSMLSSSYSL